MDILLVRTFRGASAGLFAGRLGGLIVSVMLLLLETSLSPMLGGFSLIFAGGAVLIALLLKTAFFAAICGIIGSMK